MSMRWSVTARMVNESESNAGGVRRVVRRLNTALYRLKTPSWRVAEVSTALAEGVDISAASRIFGHHERTIARWLERSGQHAQRLHEHFFEHLVCEHLQLDELVTNVRGLSERVWIWVAIEARTKIVPVIHVGRRKHDDAQRFVHQIWQRLANGCLPVFTSDGLNHYFYALTAHFGHWTLQPSHRLPVWQVAAGLRYGQLHKVKVGYRLKNLYTVALCGTRTQLREALQTLCLSGRIMTAYVERFNLTLRQLVAPLSRRTWSLACRESNLTWHLEWLRAYYHFARPHQSLRLPTAHRQRYRSRTPAMAAGLTHRRWRVRELLLRPVCPAYSTKLS
jgi:transposase-like protein